MNQKNSLFDVIVIGAGPAGSSATSLLGKYGRRVILVDKATFPRDKVCGDACSFRCIEPLSKLGLGRDFTALQVASAEQLVLSFGKHETIEVKTPDRMPIAYLTRRSELDNLLFNSARNHASVKTLESTIVERIRGQAEESVTVLLKDVQANRHFSLRGKYVICASGNGTSDSRFEVCCSFVTCW
jgi:flavin-dependent dehydrogenase